MSPDLPRIDRRFDAVMASVQQSDIAWIKQRSTGIQRAYAEMIAERGASPDGDRAAQQSPSRSVSALSGEYPSREHCPTPRPHECGQMPVHLGGPLGFLNIYRCPNCGSESWT